MDTRKRPFSERVRHTLGIALDAPDGEVIAKIAALRFKERLLEFPKASDEGSAR